MDHPNERSLHVTPRPRIGGLGIMAGVLVAAGFLAAEGLLQPALPGVLAAFALAAASVLAFALAFPSTSEWVGALSQIRASRPELFTTSDF